MLGVLSCDEEVGRHRGQDVTVWRYRLADGIDWAVLNPESVPEMSPICERILEEGNTLATGIANTDISGTGPAAATRSASHYVRPLGHGQGSGLETVG
jgi:hypothetical protein